MPRQTQPTLVSTETVELAVETPLARLIAMPSNRYFPAEAVKPQPPKPAKPAKPKAKRKPTPQKKPKPKPKLRVRICICGDSTCDEGPFRDVGW